MSATAVCSKQVGQQKDFCNVNEEMLLNSERAEQLCFIPGRRVIIYVDGRVWMQH